MALGRKAVGTAPAHGAGRAVRLPDGCLHGFPVAAAIHPDLFGEVDLQGCEPVAGEQQVLLVDQVRVGGIEQGDRQRPGAVAVVHEPFVVSGLEVLVGPGTAPPAGGHTDLRVGRADGQVEGLCLHPLSDIGRDSVNLLAGGMALGCKAVGSAPAYSTMTFRIVVLPDDGLLGFPVSTTL